MTVLNALRLENFIASYTKVFERECVIEQGHLDPLFFFFSFRRDSSSRIIPANLHESYLHEIAIKIYLSCRYGRDYSDASIIILRNYRSP